MCTKAEMLEAAGILSGFASCKNVENLLLAKAKSNQTLREQRDRLGNKCSRKGCFGKYEIVFESGWKTIYCSRCGAKRKRFS